MVGWDLMAESELTASEVLVSGVAALMVEGLKSSGNVGFDGGGVEK